MILELLEEFEVDFVHLFCDDNQMVDALATLASMCKVNKGQAVTPIEMSIYEFPAYCHNIEIEVDDLHGIMISEII